VIVWISSNPAAATVDENGLCNGGWSRLYDNYGYQRDTNWHFLDYRCTRIR